MKQLLNTLFVTSEDAYLSLENDNVVVQRDKTGLGQDSTAFIGTDFEFLLQRCISCANGPMCADRQWGCLFYTPRGRYLCSDLWEMNNRNVLLRRSQYRLP